MASLTLTIKQKNLNSKKILVELDADQFERMAANFGFFNPDFLQSLDRAEGDFRKGKIRRIRSLKDLK